MTSSDATGLSRVTVPSTRPRGATRLPARAALSPELLTLRPAARSGLAIGAGVLVALGFQPFNLWPLLIVGVAALTLVVAGQPLRRAFSLGYLFGLAMLALTVGWTYVIAAPVAVLLVAFEALWFGLLAQLLSALVGLRWWPAWAASAWVLVELLYSRIPFGGFGWFRLGFAMPDSPLAGLYPLISVAGVTYVAALLGQLLAWAAVPRHDRRRTLLRLGSALAAFALLAASSLVAGMAMAATVTTTRTVTVGMVQGNVDGVAGVESMGRARSVTRNHLAETVTLLAKARAQGTPPDFVLWPENSTDIDPILDAETNDVVWTAVRLSGVPVLVGAVTEGPGPQERQTTALWWDPVSGPGATYHKRDLVPFGEWIPFRKQLLPLVPMLSLVGRQGVPGTGPGVLDVDIPTQGRVRVGVLICFELAYDDTFREAIRGDGSTGGAQLVTVQSNNATYAGTGQIPQQWAITRIRAMESQREVLVATTNALSGFILPDGSVTFDTQQRTAASGVATMPLRDNLTPAVRFGAAIELTLALACVAALGLGLGNAWKNGTAPTSER